MSIRHDFEFCNRPENTNQRNCKYEHFLRSESRNLFRGSETVTLKKTF